VSRPAILAGLLAAGAAAVASCGGGERPPVVARKPAAAVPLPAFHAVGTEPFWALDITPVGLVFRTPEDTAGIRFVHPTATTMGDTLRWIDSLNTRSIEARVWREQCSDGMSDRAWTHRAAVRVDTLTYRGCADQT
jgi:uncharacterized membrane protein